ncbi:MAG: aldo/keto reductase [Pseudomonadota bacterium]
MSLSRREFLELCGLAGAGAMVGCHSAPPAPLARLPTRPLGKSGLSVPILAFGGVDLQPGSRLLLHHALDLGVSLWETGAAYGGGASERAIGAYLQAFPEDRPRLQLLTKSTAREPDGLARDLEGSFARMGVDAVEIFLLHGVSRAEELTPAVLAWAAEAKAAGRFGAFGFAVHKDMITLLKAAPGIAGLDVVMSACNHRLLADPRLVAALEGCRGAGIGVIAMKTQGLTSVGAPAADEGRALEAFTRRGLSLHQARLQAVWAAPAVASICSLMPTVAVLEENLAAGLDPLALGPAELGVLDAHARATAGRWCAGCAACERASGLPLPEVLRALLYAHSYGDPRRAHDLLRSLASLEGCAPAALARAQAACPQALPLAQVVREAVALTRGAPCRET